jgi:hypothetical protein
MGEWVEPVPGFFAHEMSSHGVLPTLWSNLWEPIIWANVNPVPACTDNSHQQIGSFLCMHCDVPNYV